MARIAGARLPDQKMAGIGLTYIYGIGRTSALAILTKLNLDPNQRLKDFTEGELALLREEIEKSYRVEGALRTEIGFNIKRLKEINCYVGLRHKVGLPCHGQRTKTNARTRKGKKRIATSGKRVVAKK